MPTLSPIEGIVIRMFARDHPPPRFRSTYGEFEIVVGHSPIVVIDRHAPARVRSMVPERAALPQTEPADAWPRCSRQPLPDPIAPPEQHAIFRRVLSVKVTSESRVRLVFDDGVSGAIDLRPLIDAGGVVAPRRDAAAAGQARIGGGGRWLEWPCGADLCTDALDRKVRALTDAAA
jgi:hypothetical protein